MPRWGVSGARLAVWQCLPHERQGELPPHARPARALVAPMPFVWSNLCSNALCAPYLIAQGGPDLKRYLDKRLRLKLNANRRVTGVLRGFDQFMNIVLDEGIEEVSAAESNAIGMVVIRGNSVVQFECLDRL